MFFSIISKRKFLSSSLILLFSVCFFSIPQINAQNLSKIDVQNFGPIDPTIYNFREKPQNTAVYPANKNIKETFNREKMIPAVGELDTSFNVPIDFQPGEIRSSAKQTDGKLLVGGLFKTLNDSRYKNIVRLNTDNSVDSSFQANTNGTVLTIALQTDGKILIGGSFTVVNGVNKKRIARLNADGSLDNSFITGEGADNSVKEILIQPDGKILAGGSFINASGRYSPYIIRLESNGLADLTFNSSFQPPIFVFSTGNQGVSTLSIQTDGKILAGGSFQSDPNFPNNMIILLLRLNTDGTKDSSFNNVESDSSTGGDAYDTEVLADGKILLGGIFTNLRGTNRSNLVRLTSDGLIDDSFDSTGSSNIYVSDILVTNNGKILIASFVTRSGGFAKQLNADGSVDVNFNPSPQIIGSIYTINTVLNGKIFVGGYLFPISGSIPNSGFLFNADGSLDDSFRLTSTAIGGVRAIATQPDGKIIIGGTFNRVNGVRKDKLARLNADGTIDQSFASDTISAIQINNLLLQPNGKIIVAGAGIGGGTLISGSIVRLNSDGTLDTSFNENSLSLITIKATALQNDGKILVSYSSGLPFRPTPVNQGNIARLNADGSLDKSFNSAISLPFEAIAVQPNGQILVGGLATFGYVNSGTGTDTYYYVFRLNEDGRHDRDFRAALNPAENHFTNVFALKLQSDGKILVGGSLSTQGIDSQIGIIRLESTGAIDTSFQLNPITSSADFARIEDIELLTNGQILTGGKFNNLGTSNSTNVAVLNNNGSKDNTFTATTDETVYDVAQQSNGKILVGGDFEFINGVARTSLARLLNKAIPQNRTKFDFDGDGKTDISIFRPNAGEWWYLRSSDNGNNAFQFGNSTDKLAPADFTGDGKTDVAFWRNGEWFVLRSEDSSYYSFPFGSSGDIPAPGDFDGDDIADATVFRPSNSTWYIRRSSDGGTTFQQFGVSEDKPVVADYDGDGKDDIAIFRPSNSQWWQLKSTDGVTAVQFGTNGDKTVQGDYTGDGKVDVAFYRPISGEWFILRSEDSSYFSFPFGTNGDIPVPGDYDGDGIFDATVLRPSNNTWYKRQSANGFETVTFGIANDIPIPNVYIH